MSSTDHEERRQITYSLKEAKLQYLSPILLSQAGPTINLQYYFHFSWIWIVILSVHKEVFGYEECSIKFTRVGCYRDSLINPRPIPELIMTDRDPTSDVYSGKKVEWKNWNEYLPDLVCRCAKKTRDKGYNVFGLQFYGECWSDFDSEDTYFRDGPSKECVTHDHHLCGSQERFCVGKKETNFVYALNGAITTPRPPIITRPSTKPTLKRCLKVCSRCPFMCPQLQQPAEYQSPVRYPYAGCPAICSNICVSGGMADVTCQEDYTFH
ncbi:hypothetical protein OS493_026771 [Desmophyllum pertusum]|uniref:Uncharacterized protein n=1 Tax=Desmophyllum pertusum TaxID=174260 RepID=A0A9W9ZL80_9CNID|nr:hypothetical protein OS493_026771 [Desmophyllum pertusum]